MVDKKKTTENSNSFTIDVDISTVEEMPSITKLLNRKSLSRKPSKSQTQSVTADLLSEPPPLEPPAEPAETPPEEQSSLSIEPQLSVPPSIIEPINELEPPTDSQLEMPSPVPPDTFGTSETAATPETSGVHEISIQMDAPGTPPSIELKIDGPEITGGEVVEKSMPKIQRSARKKVQPPTDLIIWELEQLKNGRDPLGQGIYKMFQKGATSALFLSILAPPPGEPVPHFVSTSAVLGKDKLQIWKGLKWNPTIVPEMWNYFIQTGLVELSPPGTLTNQNSNRNVVRAAFGISQTEWLLLVRAGPSTACRGVVAFVSVKSLLPLLQEALPLIVATSPSS